MHKTSLKISKGNQNPYIEEEQTTQWSKEKVQKDQQRTRKHTYKTKDRVTRTPLKTGGELRCSGRVSSSCFTSDTRRVNLVTNPVISYERGNNREVFTRSGTYIYISVVICGQSRKSKERKYNGKQDKRTNNDLQNNTQKNKDWATRTPQKTELNSGDLWHMAIFLFVLYQFVCKYRIYITYNWPFLTTNNQFQPWRTWQLKHI